MVGSNFWCGGFDVGDAFFTTDPATALIRENGFVEGLAIKIEVSVDRPRFIFLGRQ